MYKGLPYQDGLYSVQPDLAEPRNSGFVDPCVINKDLAFRGGYPDPDELFSYHATEHKLIQASGLLNNPIANANMFLMGYMSAINKLEKQGLGFE